MAFFLQSQTTSSCCSTPAPPEQTGTAEGVLYFPIMQNFSPALPNPSCTRWDMFQLSYPQIGTTNGGITYAGLPGPPTTFTFWVKVLVKSVDGCYRVSTYVNPNDRVALNASGTGIRIKYPTNKPYTVEVWAQICGVCAICDLTNSPPSPEWYCRYADSYPLGQNNTHIFGDATNVNNPFNITFHPAVTDAINYAYNNGGTGGVVEAKFKYMGNTPFGTNVLN